MKWEGGSYVTDNAIIGGIYPEEMLTIRAYTHIGDTIKFFIDGKAEGGTGKVIRKFKHHVLLKVGEHYESVCWVDVIRGRK